METYSYFLDRIRNTNKAP